MQVIFYAYTYGQTLCRSILIAKYFCSCGTCTINSSRWLFIDQNLIESYIWNILLTIFALSLIFSIKNSQIHISIRIFFWQKINLLFSKLKVFALHFQHQAIPYGMNLLAMLIDYT